MRGLPFERRWPGGFVSPGCGIIPFRTKEDPIVLAAGRSGVGKMLVAGAVEVDSGTPRHARLKVIEGFGDERVHRLKFGGCILGSLR